MRNLNQQLFHIILFKVEIKVVTFSDEENDPTWMHTTLSRRIIHIFVQRFPNDSLLNIREDPIYVYVECCMLKGQPPLSLFNNFHVVF